MARQFDYGAEVAVGGGAVFKNPEVGDHEALLTGIVHVGSFQDVFKPKGGKEEIKKPVNFVLLRATLMGDDDKNEDGSRMEMWRPVSLKQGDKAELTVLLNAIDPKELLGGFDDFIGKAFIASMAGSKETNEDGTPKYVNWASKGFAGCPDKLAKLVYAEAETDEVSNLGHVTFDKITREVLDAIPAHLIRQYFLSEGQGTNLSYAGSHVEALVNAARAEDKDWKAKKAGDATPDDKKPLDSGAHVPSEVPADNVPAPEMDEKAEY